MSNSKVIKDDSRQFSRDVFTIFNTSEGKRVLESLKKRTIMQTSMGQSPDGISQALVLARRSGENDFVIWLMKEIEKGRKNGN